MHEMLAPWLSSGRLTLWEETIPVAAETDGDRVVSVTLRHLDTGDETVVSAPYVLDATELGDLLELANVEHVIGAEAQAETNELHALAEADPLDQQAITWCFAVDHLPGEDHTIEKPAQYDFWKEYQADFWPDKQLSWHDVHPITLETRYRAIFEPDADGKPAHDFWHYRRILDKGKYPEGTFASDISLVNWPQIDYWLGPLVGVSEEEKAKHLEASFQLSLSLLYWMQTEAPTIDGGTGYPGLRLRSDVTGTHARSGEGGLHPRGAPDPGRIHRGRGARRRRAVAGRAGEVPRQRRRRLVPDRSAPIDRAAHLRRHQFVAVPDSARVADPATGREPAAGEQEPRGHAHHQRLLPAAPGGMEHRRGGGSTGRLGAAKPANRHARSATTKRKLTGFQDTLVKTLGFELDWPSIRPR